jgi:hypothetical protein
VFLNVVTYWSEQGFDEKRAVVYRRLSAESIKRIFEFALVRRNVGVWSLPLSRCF